MLKNKRDVKRICNKQADKHEQPYSFLSLFKRTIYDAADILLVALFMHKWNEMCRVPP